FDLIPRTPEDDEDDGNGDEDQGLRISEEEKIQEEEEADELYRNVDINQGRGLQVSQDIEDSHVTLTPVQPDGQQESSSVSSFVTSMLNLTSDAGVESIFTTASSPIAPLPTTTPIMTPSTIATITTSRNKSIQRSDEQRNLYKALVDAYKADKTILESYGDTAILKRRRGDDDDQEGPSAGSDRGSKRRREGGEHESASTSSEPATKSASRSTTGTQSRQMSASAEDQPIVQTSQHPEWFSQPRKPPTPDRDWNKTLPAIQGSSQTWISNLSKQADSRSTFNELLDTPIDFSNFIMNRLCVDTLTPELLAGLTFKLMRGSCTSLTELEYHLEEERFAFNVSLRMFTRSIVIQRRVEDLQLGVESYQKRLNLTKPDMYRSDLKRREAYTAYSNPRGFIYQNKDKKNRLMRIDELPKFSDRTLNDVCNALDDRLKGIRMRYLPQAIWRKGDKDRAAAMIQSNDKMLKARSIMRSLERFVGGRLYEGDFQMLQRTI
nr:hypothetical protein [Tanacetum cinerariifolium]